MEKIWIVKGEISDAPDVLEAYSAKYQRQVKTGEVEWQFSDGPPGERGSSNDFLDLEEGKAWCRQRYGEVEFIMVED